MNREQYKCPTCRRGHHDKCTGYVESKKSEDNYYCECTVQKDHPNASRLNVIVCRFTTVGDVKPGESIRKTGIYKTPEQERLSIKVDQEPEGYICGFCLDGHHYQCNGKVRQNFLCNCARKDAESGLTPITHELDTLRKVMGLPDLIPIRFQSEFTEKETNLATQKVIDEFPQIAYGTELDDGSRKPDDIFWWGGKKKTVRELNDMRRMGYLSNADYRKALRLPEKLVKKESEARDTEFVLKDYTAHVCRFCVKGNHEQCKTDIQYDNGTIRRDCDCWALSHQLIVAIDKANGIFGLNEQFLEEINLDNTIDAAEKLVKQVNDGIFTREEIGREFMGKPTNTRAHILQTAEKLINGDRADTYGPPEQSFGRIADLLNAMGWRVYKESPDTSGIVTRLDAVDVALGLMQLKVSRIISSPDHEDSWVDAAGYAALGGEMAIRRGVSLKAAAVTQEGLDKLNATRGAATSFTKKIDTSFG